MSNPTLSTAIATEVAMAAADEICAIEGICIASVIHGVLETDMVPGLKIAALLEKHFQPLLAKVEGEAAPDAPKMPFPFHVKADEPHLRVHPAVNTGNQDRELGQWSVKIYNGLVCVVAIAHGQTKKAAEERANKIVYAMQHVHELTALRADLAAKEAALGEAFVAMDGAAFYFEKRNTGMRGQGICAKLKEAMHTIKYPPASALASRADKGGAR